MKTLPPFLTKILAVLSILLALSFLLMPLNIMIYYGFQPSAIHSPSQNNPFNISIATIWIVHLTLGFFAGMGFGKKTVLLTGIMGLFCAAIITGFSFVYYSWRTSLISIEAIIPLIVGIVPTMKLYDYLKGKMDVKPNESKLPRWTPISLSELTFEIQKTEKALQGDLFNFWQMIQIQPVKWVENQQGNEGGGFWVVAIHGNKVIWYNDIEEGFNISDFDKSGEINEYGCEQDELSWAVTKLFQLKK